MRLIFKDLPRPFHDLAHPAHQAARCAGALGKYWPYHDRLFAEQPKFGRERLIDYASAIGLEREPFARCLEAREYAAAVDADIAEAQALGVTATPTFFINGRELVGAHPVETFRSIIDAALARHR